MCIMTQKNIKIFKTCNLYLSMFSLGLSLSITGPCLLDLQRIVGTDIQHIALIYTARSIGYLVGAILGGILLDVFKSKQAVLTGCNFFVAISMFGFPWSRNVETLLGFAVVNGIALGAIETGSNVVCLQLWRSGPIFQGLYFNYGIGGLIAPLIAAPFLRNQNNDNFLSNNTSYSKDPAHNVMLNLSSGTEFTESIENITYPFSFIGAFALIVTILFLADSLLSPTDEDGPQSDSKNNSNRSCVFMFSVITLIFFLFFVVIGAEVGYAQTITTYAVKGSLHTTITTGSYITSAYWTAFTVSRLVQIFLAIKISDITLIICNICIFAVSVVLLVFFMPNESILWAASIIFGAGIASSYPAFVGWIDTHIHVTSKISSIFVIGCAAGEMVVPFIIAYFIEAIPEMLIYTTAVSFILVILLLLTLYLVLKKGKKKCPSNETECYAISSNIVSS